MKDTSTTLNDVCEFIVDCLHSTAPIQDEGYPLIRTPNIGKGRLILDGVYRVSEDIYESWTRRAVPETGDLILAREAPAGNVAIIKNGQQVCLGQRTVHLRPDKSQVDPGFLCYYLLAPRQQGALLAGETGVTAKHVNMKDIRRLPLKGLPCLSVQHKIGQTISAYDDLIENNRRRIQLLEQAARLLYKEWFVHLSFPGHEHVKIKDGIPEWWEKKPLGELLTLQRGFDLPGSQRKEGRFPIYASTGINGCHTEAKVKGPGVVTGRSGSLGTVMFVAGDFWPLNTALWVKDFKLVGPHFAKHLLENMHLEQYNGGAAVPTLNRNDVHGVEVLNPPSLLRQLFEEQSHDIVKQTDTLTSINSKLVEARDFLLPRLMTGEIAV
jgi:type I restriction enzyme S subunit